MSDWANILPEVLILIMQRLPFMDFLAARIVCVPWKRIAATIHPKPDMPWLMIPGGIDSTAKFFSLSSCRVLTTRLPDPPIHSRVVIGSDYGWIVTVDDQCEMHLLNPISGVQFALPPITSFPSVKAVPESTHHSKGKQFRVNGVSLPCDLMRSLFFKNAIIMPTPQPNSYIVMLITDCTKLIVAFARNGDEVWESQAMPDLGHTLDKFDVIFHKGCFYMITLRGAIVAWEPCGRSFVPRVIRVGLLQLEEVFWSCFNLVESPAGNLMLMLLQFAPYGDPCLIESIELFVLDEKENKWVHEKDIGTNALFLSTDRVLCFSTEEHLELKANSVYFATYHSQSLSFLLRQDPFKIGVYDIKSRRVRSIKKLPGIAHLIWDPPIWLSPSLR